MTDLEAATSKTTAPTTAPTTAAVRATRPRVISMLAFGLFGGAALGIAARAWMRLIADDPEFTWGGTIFIIIAFTIFGFTQSIVAVARRRTRRRWTLTIARVIGTVGLLPLFVGAGALMLPTVVGGGLALARVEWHRLARAICLVLAAAPVLFVGSDLVSSFGWSLHALAGFIGMLAIYGTVVLATRFTFAAQPGGKKRPRWLVITFLVILGLLLLQFSVGVLTA
jgi:hypothetical protein